MNTINCKPRIPKNSKQNKHTYSHHKLRYTIVKLLKTNDEEKHLKAARERGKHITHRGTQIKNYSKVLIRNMQEKK